MKKDESTFIGCDIIPCLNDNITKSFGGHFIIELVDCLSNTLKWVDYVEKTMMEVVEKSSSRMVGSCFHQFQPEGVSGIILIKESHFSIHTWPEASYAAADIFTCGSEMNPYVAIELMKERFGAKEVRYQEIKRGF